MPDSSDDLKQLGMLAIGLLILMVILGVTFIVGDQFLEVTCEDIDGGTYNITATNVCHTIGNSSEDKRSTAYNATSDTIDAISIIVSFVALIVIVLIAKLIIQIVRSVQQN